MSKSKQELITRALRELGVIGSGQAAAAEDVSVISDELGPAMSDLASRGVYTWGNPDSYDDDAFVHLAVVLANSCARSFGVEPDDGKRLRAEQRLRAINVATLSGQPQPTEYY